MKRKSDGTFADGNEGGPGRPAWIVERDYVRAMSDAITLEDWSEIVKVAVKDAKAGDAKARAWLAKYLVGDASLWDSLNGDERQERDWEAADEMGKLLIEVAAGLDE